MRVLTFSLSQIVKRPFCAAGYLSVLFNAKGKIPEMVGFCDDLPFKNVEIAEVKPAKGGDIW